MTTTPTASPELLDLNRMSFLTGTIVAAPMLETDIVMHDLRITKAGIVYKGEKVNDAGAVHAALMDVLVRGAPLPPRAQPEGEAPQADWISSVVRDVAELPDRDSPPGREDMMLVTVNELHNIIERHAPAATLSPLCGAQQAAAPGAMPVCSPNCFYGDCPPCVEAGVAPSAPGTPEAPTGYAIVPIEPTERMIYEGGIGRRDQMVDAADVWRQMLRAAQLDGGQEGSGS